MVIDPDDCLRYAKMLRELAESASDEGMRKRLLEAAKDFEKEANRK